MEFYDSWSTAVDEGQDAIEAYFADHLYPDLPACAPGEKQLDVLTADRDTIRPADDWTITWGPLNGTVPEGRIYEVNLAEQTSLSHVSILNDTVYVFWNCTGVAAGPADPAVAAWDQSILSLPEGMTCEALVDAGYTYADAFAYYVIIRGQDGGTIDWENGSEIPCEHTYPADEVAAYWGNGPITTTQFAYLVSVDPIANTVVADYATWYTGDEAVQACESEGNSDCDNFYTRLYYISNTNPRLRTLNLTESATIAIGFAYAPYDCGPLALPPILDAAGMDWSRFSSFGGCLATPAQLAGSADWGNYVFPEGGLKVWLNVDGDEVHAIQTQYVP